MHISQGYSEDNIRKSGVKSCFIIFMIAMLEYIILQDLTPLRPRVIDTQKDLYLLGFFIMILP